MIKLPNLSEFRSIVGMLNLITVTSHSAGTVKIIKIVCPCHTFSDKHFIQPEKLGVWCIQFILSVCGCRTAQTQRYKKEKYFNQQSLTM